MYIALGSLVSGGLSGAIFEPILHDNLKISDYETKSTRGIT